VQDKFFFVVYNRSAKARSLVYRRARVDGCLAKVLLFRSTNTGLNQNLSTLRVLISKTGAEVLVHDVTVVNMSGLSRGLDGWWGMGAQLLRLYQA